MLSRYASTFQEAFVARRAALVYLNEFGWRSGVGAGVWAGQQQLDGPLSAG